MGGGRRRCMPHARAEGDNHAARPPRASSAICARTDHPHEIVPGNSPRCHAPGAAPARPPWFWCTDTGRSSWFPCALMMRCLFCGARV